MNLTVATEDRLVIDHRNWSNAAWGLGIIACVVSPMALGVDLIAEAPPAIWLALTIGAALAVFGTERTQFWADRTQGRFALRRKTLFGRSEAVHALSDLAEVILTQVPARGGRSDWRAEIRLTDGTVLPVSRFFGSERNQRRAFDAIRDWLTQAGEGPAW